MPARVLGALRRHPSGALLAVQLLGLLESALYFYAAAGTSRSWYHG